MTDSILTYYMYICQTILPNFIAYLIDEIPTKLFVRAGQCWQTKVESAKIALKFALMLLTKYIFYCNI